MSAYGYLVYQDTTLPLENNVTLIGRAPSCHIKMNHPSISKEHAIIEFSDTEGAILKDLNSLNGIYIQNSRMPKGSLAYLQNGMPIIFGKDPTPYSFFYASDRQKDKKAPQPNPRSPIAKDPKDIPVSLVDPQAILEEKSARPRDNSLSNNRNLATFAQIKEEPKSEHSELAKQNTGNFNQSLSNSDQFKNNSSVKMLPQAQNQFIEKTDKLQIQSELLELNERVLEREELLMKKDNELKLYKGEVDAIREDADRQRSKLKAIELYATELQRKNDLLSRELVEKNNQIREMESTDWTKKAQITGSELNHLRQILLAKDEEINSLKKQIQAILQRHTDGGANASHYQNFLEQQAKELANAKKHLQEYENRNEECKRKWNQLIKENINKEEKVKGLTLQLNRQIETYQGLYSETDAKIAALYTKFAQLVSQDEESRERDAAEFLVSQMKQIQEEREKYASENEQLHLQTQELIEEIKRLNAELQEYQKYFDKNEMNGILEGKPVNAGKMKSRIEELEDLVYEVKQKEGARKTVELSDILVDLERKYTYQVKLTDELKNKLVEFSSGVPTQDQNAIEFFSKLLDDKDQKISYQQRQIDVLASKEKQYLVENEKLKESLKQLSIQYENFKSRQTKLEDAISTRIAGQSYIQKDLSSGFDPYAYVSRNIDPSNLSDHASHQLYSDDDKFNKFKGGNAIDKFLAFDNAK